MESGLKCHISPPSPSLNAPRFYPLFGQLSSVAPIIAGQFVAHVAHSEDFSGSLRILTLLTTASGVGIVGLYRYCTLLFQSEEGEAPTGSVEGTHYPTRMIPLSLNSSPPPTFSHYQLG